MDMGQLWDVALGLREDPENLSVVQMAVRSVIVYVVTVAIVQLGKKRFLGRGSAFDIIVGIMLGSIASRAITGNAPLAPALTAAATLLAVHWLFSAIALHWSAFGTLIKGKSLVVIRDGEIDEAAARKAHLTERDIYEDLREKSVEGPQEVAEGRLERNGSLSILKQRREPKVVEVRVEEGVQHVRIEI